VFATEVSAEWVYSKLPMDPGRAWNTVVDAIIKQFAGPAKTGVMSLSVQNTLYLAQLDILREIPQVITIHSYVYVR
jgi:urate oxidase